MAQAQSSVVKWDDADIIKPVRFPTLEKTAEKIEIYKSKLEETGINARDAEGLLLTWKVRNVRHLAGGASPFGRVLFFSHSHISLVTLWRFIFSLLVWKPPRQATLHRFLGLSNRTIVDWYSFYREVCVHDVSSQTEKLGGEGRVVEVDEAKIGRRKYNKGRIIEGQWIFGGIERESRKRFLVPVETRDSQTLLSVLKEWVLPGTTVISDCWKAYDCLQTEGFHHLTVNHKYNFVDPQTGSHTNTIERMWREVRANVPRYGVRKEHMVGYLAEYLFKAKYPDMGSRLHHFQVAAANLYPPGY
ncbi:uncharacterized protein LOC111618774 [Centruroides sculpturatus]|uniref:uncharacterized protein LOC111618774 n=1 Tax=Centruroides sculpturatus TaxID=218467 RepID=UPI000C6ED334|nr:uncharacterized protein LOC111618774 [Centruroides sculpturatus]